MWPFHAAEHQRDDRKRSLTCLSTPQGVRVFKLPVGSRSAGQFDTVEPSDRLPFLVRFWASKNEL